MPERSQSVLDVRIGEASGRRFTLPADVQTVTSAVLGIRGSGKSHTASVVVEDLLELGCQVVVIDPTDVWWGLRSSADGKKPGRSIVVCGGTHGQLPLAEADGATLADVVVEERCALVLSLRHLRKNAQRRFVTDFAEQLYHRKGEAANRTPLLLVIDEADLYVPQRVGAKEARMVGAIEDLVRRGRAAGIGVTLISQRTASINKDVLTQLELLVAHRHTSPQDRKALEAWIEAHDVDDHHDEFMSSLASLKRGEAWFWSPGWVNVFARVQVRARATFDSSSTPAGGTAKAPKVLAEVDLEALKTRLAETVRKAEENDPAKLRRRIADLEAAAPRVQTVERPVVPADLLEVLDRHAERMKPYREMVTRLRDELRDIGMWIEEFESELRTAKYAATRSCGVSKPTSKPTAGRGSAVSYSATKPRQAATKSADGKISGGVARALSVLISRFPDGLTERQWATLSGFSPRGGTWRTYRSRLNVEGWIERDGDLWKATSAAYAGYSDLRVPVSPDDAIAEWREKLGAGPSRMIDAIGAQAGITREQLAVAVQMEANGGSFRTYLSKLRSNGLIEVSGNVIRLTDVLQQ